MARRDEAGPYSLDALAELPFPQLFTRDADVLRARYIAWFEEATDRTLYPVQVEMILIDMLAYVMSLVGEEAQATAQQHLVAKAAVVGLAQLGANRSTPQLPAATAVTTMRFSLTQVRPANVLVDAGTRVSAGSGGLVFLTLAPAVIVAGALFAEVPALASQAGVVGNGFLPGQIATVLDPIAGVTAANTVASEGGADVEDTELWRLRIANAFDRVSTGGSRGWYRETTMGVSSAIVDVAVIRPQPCYVDIYPLTATGAAGSALRNQVKAAFDTQANLDIRFGDEVTIKVAVAVPIAPHLIVRLTGATEGAAQLAADTANAILESWRQQLAAVISPNLIEKAVSAKLKAAGFVVDDVEVTGMAFDRLAPEEFAVPVLIAPAAVELEVANG